MEPLWVKGTMASSELSFGIELGEELKGFEWTAKINSLLATVGSGWRDVVHWVL